MGGSTIKDVILAPGYGSFFDDDQAAIRTGAAHDCFRYLGTPLTPGFTTIRVPARSLSIGLVLSDDVIVWGDMMSVQYLEALTRSVVIPRLLAADLSNFLAACERVLAGKGASGYHFRSNMV